MAKQLIHWTAQNGENKFAFTVRGGEVTIQVMDGRHAVLNAVKIEGPKTETVRWWRSMNQYTVRGLPAGKYQCTFQVAYQEGRPQMPELKISVRY